MCRRIGLQHRKTELFDRAIVTPPRTTARRAAFSSVETQLTGIAQLKLLVVDDSDDIRRCVVNCLRDEGYTVSEARDGAEALLVFEKLGADLILMDIQMPVVNGVEAARELRRRDISLPIFAFTGTPQIIDESRHLFTGLMAKPMELSKLCEGLQDYFKAHPKH